MCSHENITWKVVQNAVACRMIDNSLTHKFLSSQRVRKRTKLFNSKVKKYGVIKNYEQYVAMKTSVLRKVSNDCDTDDTDNLSDVDYSIIHNSESKLNEYRRKDSIIKLSSDEDEEINKVMSKMKKNGKAKSVEKKAEKPVNIKQEEDSLSQVCFNSDENDSDRKMENNRIKPVKKKIKKSVSIEQQENSLSQVSFTSDKNRNDKRKSQGLRKTKSSETKSVGESTKTPISTEWEENFTSQSLFTDDDNVNNNEKENQMILKRRKHNKTKPSEKKTRKSVNIGWQDVVLSKKNRSTTRISDIGQCTGTSNMSKQNTSQNGKCNHSKTDSNKRSLSPYFESQDNIMSCTANLVSKDIPQNHTDPLTVVAESDSESDSPNNITSCKVESIDDKDATQNQGDSKATANETNFESNCQDDAVACKANPEEETVIQEELKVPHSSLINDPPSSVSERLPSLSEDRSCEEPAKVEEQVSISAKNYDDGCVSPQTARSVDNIKRNLAFTLDTVNCPHQSSSSPDASHDQQKDSGIDEDSQDKFVKRLATEKSDNAENIVEKTSVSPEHEETNEMAEEMRENHTNDISLKVKEDSLEEQDIVHNIEATQVRKARVPETDDSPETSQTDAGDVKANGMDGIAEDSCNVQEKQLKIMSTEIVNTRYRIVTEKSDNVNVTGTDACAEMTNEIPIAQQVVSHEEDEEEEEDAARCVSPQTKQQLQRQLNLIVDSNSSESESEDRPAVGHSSKIVHADDSNSSHRVEGNCSKDNQRIGDGASGKIDVDTSHSDAACKDARASLEKDASEENDTSRSEDSRECLREQQRKKLENDERSRASEESGIDISHDKDNREEASAEERFGSDERNSASEERHREGPASTDGGNANGDSQRQDRANSGERETQNVCYRPRNLGEFAEDEELLVETLPASITLADISEDEEAFILNIPNKVLQCNLQGQRMILKENTIRFGKSKFGVVHNQVNTVTCIFATGKRRKPYKIVNLKEISTVTVRERLSNFAKDSTELDSRDIDTFPERKSKKRRCILSSDDDTDNRQIDESKSKKLKITDYHIPRRRDHN
ncbi:PREDICTED: dentin sialophosphoprotein-like [Dinoponera quadriceps]|uniref:Dentin sialophosphoprotein-like n=1 Tax=Dinoponera quadriceps TaxID=609295 RepID=A0A6P3WNH7_DINQU|nr:PREDICTED: dentin sialophosphoprotein-like [Dinoponera quadriceps]